MYNKLPFTGENMLPVMAGNYDIPQDDPHVEPWMVNTLRRMLTADPEQRPDIFMVLESFEGTGSECGLSARSHASTAGVLTPPGVCVLLYDGGCVYYACNVVHPPPSQAAHPAVHAWGLQHRHARLLLLLHNNNNNKERKSNRPSRYNTPHHQRHHEHASLFPAKQP